MVWTALNLAVWESLMTSLSGVVVEGAAVDNILPRGNIKESLLAIA